MQVISSNTKFCRSQFLLTWPFVFASVRTWPIHHNSTLRLLRSLGLNEAQDVEWIDWPGLRHRLLVLALAFLIALSGWFTVNSLPIDVFPDLTKPTVTILTEGHGRAPEEVETLITVPIEAAVGGLPSLNVCAPPRELVCR